MAFDTSKISKLGFGCMRFEGRETDTIDIELTSQLVDVYMEHGGNYFDTAWAYPNSEAALRKALVERHPRDSFSSLTNVLHGRIATALMISKSNCRNHSRISVSIISMSISCTILVATGRRLLRNTMRGSS